MPRSLLCILATIGLISASGCGSENPVAAGSTPASPTGGGPTAFNLAACGTLTGLVTWAGPLPETLPYTHVVPRADGSGLDIRHVALANAPRINQWTRGVAGAVVFLRGIDPNRARPWDLPPVSVEFWDSQIGVIQGGSSGRAGFVRRGDRVPMQSKEPGFHVLRGRGAAFFAIPFPDPDSATERTFDTCGRVELTSATGLYWQAANLFVTDHPYYALTDADGRFSFAQVPAGQYELVVWHPNWNVARIERNPESGLPNRLCFLPPLEIARPVSVSPRHTTLANITLPK